LPALANRLSHLPPYPFQVINQQVAALKAAGADIINLDVGSPDMPPPVLAMDVLSEEAHQPGTHGYSGYRGTASFRKSVAEYYARRFGVQVDPERQVLPLLGSKEGIVNLSMAYLDRGDAALVPNIGYPAYSMGAILAGAETHWLPVEAGNHFHPDLNQIAPTMLANAKILWVNFPNNPTGAAADLAWYQHAVDFCAHHNLLLASDNPYVEVTFGDLVAPSVLQARGALNTAIEFISFSKTFNMAGWRLGAAVGSETAISALLQVKSNVDSGHFVPIYSAGSAVIEEVPADWIRRRNQVYERRRDRIVQAMPSFGLEPYVPQGALYVWARVSSRGLDGAAYVSEALQHAHVSMAPGAIYGPGGSQYVRMSVCTPDARLDEALHRLQAWYALK
jgi:LL-diaminopimelate aminotransferase